MRTLLLTVVPVAAIALPVGHWIRRPPPPLPTRPVPVRGTVTLDGVPLDGASVGFVPIESVPLGDSGVTFRPGMAARAMTTDIAGKFKLEIPIMGLRPMPGCYPGSYAVVIAKWEMNDPPPGATLVTPERYDNVEMPCLTAEVTKYGPNIFIFNLTTP